MANPLIRPTRSTGPELSSFDPETFIVIDNVVWSVAVEETHERTATITDHPIEGGGLISDHVQREPARYSAELVVSNQPIDTTPVSLLTNPDQVAEVDATLERIMDAGLPVQMITGLRVYSSMIIESYTVSRNARTGQMLSASLSLREVRLVEAETTDIPASLVRADKRAAAAPQVDAGTQTGTQGSVEGSGTSSGGGGDKSILAGGLDAAGNVGDFDILGLVR